VLIVNAVCSVVKLPASPQMWAHIGEYNEKNYTLVVLHKTRQCIDRKLCQFLTSF